MASLGILKCSCHIVWSGKLVSSAIEIYTRINMEIRWIRYHAKISFVYIAYFVSMLFQYFLGKYLNKAFNGIFVYMLCIVTQEHTKLFSLLEFAFLPSRVCFSSHTQPANECMCHHTLPVFNGLHWQKRIGFVHLFAQFHHFNFHERFPNARSSIFFHVLFSNNKQEIKLFTFDPFLSLLLLRWRIKWKKNVSQNSEAASFF